LILTLGLCHIQQEDIDLLLLEDLSRRRGTISLVYEKPEALRNVTKCVAYLDVFVRQKYPQLGIATVSRSERFFVSGRLVPCPLYARYRFRVGAVSNSR
jgi:hypothetical protein